MNLYIENKHSFPVLSLISRYLKNILNYIDKLQKKNFFLKFIHLLGVRLHSTLFKGLPKIQEHPRQD